MKSSSSWTRRGGGGGVLEAIEVLAEAGGASAAEAMGSFAAPWDAAARRRGRGEALGGGATTTGRVGALGGGARHALKLFVVLLKSFVQSI